MAHHDPDSRDSVAIYRDGAHYDRMWGRGYVEFWLSQASMRGGPVLELGCGTGKLSIPPAEAGYAVTGLDNSTGLLAFAAGKSKAVRWVEGDMRDFDLGERFALIMLPSNNLGHLHTPEDFERCIDCVRRHLLPSGVLVIDVVGSLDLKMYFPRELEALVRCNGLKLLARYGDHDGRAFDDESRFQILVCEDSGK